MLCSFISYSAHSTPVNQEPLPRFGLAAAHAGARREGLATAGANWRAGTGSGFPAGGEAELNHGLPRAERLFALVTTLDGRRGKRPAELARALGVHRSTVHRDLLALQELGIGIVSGPEGYRLLRGAYAPPVKSCLCLCEGNRRTPPGRKRTVGLQMASHGAGGNLR